MLRGCLLLDFLVHNKYKLTHYEMKFFSLIRSNGVSKNLYLLEGTMNLFGSKMEQMLNISENGFL